MSDLERYSISGNPSPEEEKRVLAALERMLREEKEQARPSAWKMAGRAGARGLGATELRHRIRSRSWQMAARTGWSGPAQDERRGRGDAK